MSLLAMANSNVVSAGKLIASLQEEIKTLKDNFYLAEASYIARHEEALTELESVKKDNANLIEMNFNLEQQVSALKEDLEQANDDCGDWELRYETLEYKVQGLLDALNSIEEIAQNR